MNPDRRINELIYWSLVCSAIVLSIVIVVVRWQ
jgi:hypothetical protein